LIQAASGTVAILSRLDLSGSRTCSRAPNCIWKEFGIVDTAPIPPRYPIGFPYVAGVAAFAPRLFPKFARLVRL